MGERGGRGEGRSVGERECGRDCERARGGKECGREGVWEGL